ncbi:MAG TPA: M23 family metallopeptidase, partial [Baekduia sp.]|nr:M23 family metallopeptidase [Baekduia sp.]
MPRNVLALIVVMVVAALDGAGPASAAAAGEHWRRPLPRGAVVGSFTFERAAPYARGRRRGIDVAGRPGAPVLAVCAGIVTHAGRVPGFGRGVSLRCGRLVATELGLRATAVTRGARVMPGATVGHLADAGVLRLGARIANRPHGYVDPLGLIEEAAPGRPT